MEHGKAQCGSRQRKREARRGIPDTGFLRLTQIIGDAKADPPVPALIPIGRSTWWHGVRTGRFPQPFKLGPRTTVWRAEDIHRLIEEGV